MGSFPGGLHYSRDNSTIIDDVNVLGQEWQVLSSEPQMFHNIDGPQHPKACAMPTETETSRKRRLGTATLDQVRSAVTPLRSVCEETLSILVCSGRIRGR